MAVLIVFAYTPLEAPALIAAVNVYVWRRHREIMREQARA